MPSSSPESSVRRVIERRIHARRPKKDVPPPDDRNARTREAILAAALSLYADEGYGAVTMRGIAQRLGFSAPAIYNYFLSKEEIFATLQEIGLEVMAEAVLTPVSDDALADFRAIFTNYYAYSKAHPEYFALLYVDPSAPHLTYETSALKRMADETNQRFVRCLEAGVFADHTPVHVPGLFWALVHGIAVLRRVQAMPPDANFDPQVTVGLDLLIAGLKAGLVPPHAYAPPATVEKPGMFPPPTRS
ncbi:MAG: TetR/AcrR family transcriptional regulator [Vicinamibacterales bacterium]